MSNVKRLLAGLILLIGSTVCARSIHAETADEHMYTLASFEGDYAVVGTGGANVAGLLGTIKSDGQGSVSGSALANLRGQAQGCWRRSHLAVLTQSTQTVPVC